MGSSLPSVLVVGGGELGSAVAHRLHQSGMMVAVADLAQPRCIRTAVCFATALRLGTVTVEGVTGVRASAVASDPRELAGEGKLPVFAVDGGDLDWRPLAASLDVDVVVDARMLKRSHGSLRGLAKLTIGLGPGFSAGDDVDAVIETNRGPDLGRVIYEGSAEADTGVPAAVGGASGDRVIRAPLAGSFAGRARVGDLVEQGSVVGTITKVEGDAASGSERREPRASAATQRAAPGTSGRADVIAPIGGLLRGLVMDGTSVKANQKIGDLDPRGRAVDFAKISDKGRAVAGGVLEAIMHWWAADHA
ncbi:MAG TPA: molybdenum hydroxylase [bacterium]|nr:molybdenum hydroxylase [bacterium]